MSLIDTEQPAEDFTSSFRLFGFFRKQFHSGRGGRAKLAISTSFIVRAITAAVSFVILPITVRYLGNEGYGLMATISAVVGWLQFSSMGIGLGLQNALTEETAKGNASAQKELVSTAVFSLLGIGLFLILGGLIVFPHVNWLSIFPPTTSRFTAEIPWTVLVVFLGFVSTIVLGFVGPIYAARLELHVANIQTLSTSLLTLLGTFVAVHNRWGLFGVVVCTIGITAIIQWLFALWTLYGRGIREIRPALSKVTRKAAARIYKNGISFFIMQLCNIAFFQIDAFLIARFLTIDQVTPYSVAQKVYIQLDGIFGIVIGSLWSAYGHAKAQNDFGWIQRTFMRVLRTFGAMFAGCAIIVVVFGHRLFSWWVGAAATPSTWLIVAITIYFAVRGWNSMYAMLLNGLDVIRPQIWCLVATAVLTLGFDLLLIRRIGPAGLAIGSALASLSIAAWYLPYLKSKVLNQANA